MSTQRYNDYPSDKDKVAFKRYLAEDEELILATGFGRTYLRQRFTIQFFLLGSLFILTGLAWAYLYHKNYSFGITGGLIAGVVYAYLNTWIAYQANRYLLTTRRVILKRGFFTVKLITALYDKITHIELNQSLIDRFFLHHGTVLIHTAGSSKDEMTLKYVEAPIEFKNILERLIHKERESFGRQTTQVDPIEGEVIED